MTISENNNLRAIELDYNFNSTLREIYISDIDVDTPFIIKQRAQMIYDVTANNVDPITLVLSSFGGDAYGMFGAIDTINLLPSKVNTIGLGAVQSAASGILVSGTGSRKLSKGSFVMIHQISGFMPTQLDDVLVETAHSKLLQKKYFTVISEHSNKPYSFWEKKTKNNFYLSADDCLNYGLIDEII